MSIFKSKPNEMPTVGLVTFDSYVGMYAETLRYVSWKLQHLGCKVVRVGCDGVLGACTSFNSLGDRVIDSNTKEEICRVCKGAQLKIPADHINNVGSDQSLIEQDAIDFLNRVESKLKTHLAVSAVLEMNYQQLPLCKIAFFDFAIALKVSQVSLLNESAISRFMLGLRDLLILREHFEFFLQQNQLTHVVYINGNYSLNTLIRILCTKKKVVCLSIEPQLTSQHILNYVLLKKDRIELSPEALLTANSESNINPACLSGVLNNFGARITGGDFNAYTSLGDVCDQNETAKIIIFFDSHPRVHSFFMSSEDELVPHIVTHDFSNELDEEYRTAYSNQFEFIQYFIAEAEKNPDIGFIVRLHPRMAVNKRDLKESLEHQRYKKLLDQVIVAPNVLIIYGDSKVSSYYLIGKSNLVIVSWSTIGLEAMMMGVPVVSVFPNTLMYPLVKFSGHPQNFDELKIALFSSSKYGVADDIKLFNWVSMAHEGQFFKTLAPRGLGGRASRLYRLIYRLVDKLGIYNLFAQLMDKIWCRDIIFSDELLLTKRTKEQQSLNNVSSRMLINLYRTKVKKMLNRYEEEFSKSISSGVISNSQKTRN
jgi:hypothetical protein